MHKIFGFPYGGDEIILLDRADANCDTVQKWRANFGITSGSVSLEVLTDEMTEGKKWFKRHFIVLLYSTVIENAPNGQCNMRIMNLLKDLKRIPHYFKCKLVLEAAKKGKEWT